MPSTPAAIMAYSCQLVSKTPIPPEKVPVMPFISAAVRPKTEPAATPSAAAR